MDEIQAYAETVGIEVSTAESDPATSTLDKLRAPSTARTSEAATSELLIFQCYKGVFLDSERTAIQQQFPSKFLAPQSLSLEDIQVTPTLGEFAILDFASSAWRLVIVKQNIRLPVPRDGGCSGLDLLKSEKLSVLVARLYARPQTKLDTCSNALSVSHVVVREGDAAGILSWLRTALLQSSQLIDATSQYR